MMSPPSAGTRFAGIDGASIVADDWQLSLELDQIELELMIILKIRI
jgi:hypothetical protein